MAMDTADRVRRLNELYPGLPIDCGNSLRPGVVDDSVWGDYSRYDTTPDQLRIERYLSGQNLQGARVLHVGVGNSNFALRFHRSVASIVGTTMTESERDKALALKVPGYRCLMHNKYLGDDGYVGGDFDFVIENSLTTYACCLTHFTRMMEFYAGALAERGQLVTDLQGLAHLIDLRPELAEFSFSFHDLAQTAPLFGLTAFDIDSSVFVLARCEPPAQNLRHGARNYAYRLEGLLRGVSRR